MEKLAILLVDDQKLFVDNLKIVLESRTKDMKVVGIAYDGKDAVELAAALEPSIVLMDVRMPIMDGVEATKIIRRKQPDVRIVMLTTFDDDVYVQQALKHGASGYILKNVSPSELITSIRAVKNGAVLISPTIAERLLHKEKVFGDAEDVTTTPREMKRLLDSLTPREKEIVQLISQAYGNKQIAERLSIGEQTVKNALSTIFMKIGVARRMQLMRFFEECRRNGLLP